MAYDTEGARRARAFPIKMPYQEGPFHQPFERRMPMRCGWESRMGSHRIPFTNQDIKLFHRAGGLRREVSMLLHVHTPFVFSRAPMGQAVNFQKLGSTTNYRFFILDWRMQNFCAK